MRNNNPANRWRKLVLEMKRSLIEGDVTPKETGEDSLDDQIDRYFSSYESEAKSSKTEGKDWRRTVRRIVEAEDAPADEPDVAKEPKKLSSDSIDVNSFANDVIRLIENYDSLLEVRNTILRRAANFISKNYEPTALNRFKENLRNEHGMEIGKSHSDMEKDNFQPPPAARAGGIGGTT